jgi:hypothetical protein
MADAMWGIKCRELLCKRFLQVKPIPSHAFNLVLCKKEICNCWRALSGIDDPMTGQCRD